MDNSKEKLFESEDSKELDALYELHDFWEDNVVVREHHGLTLDKAITHFDLIETSLKNLNKFQKDIKLCAHAYYDEIRNSDSMQYYLIFNKNHKKEYISQDLFRALKPILGVNYE